MSGSGSCPGPGLGPSHPGLCCNCVTLGQQSGAWPWRRWGRHKNMSHIVALVLLSFLCCRLRELRVWYFVTMTVLMVNSNDGTVSQRVTTSVTSPACVTRDTWPWHVTLGWWQLLLDQHNYQHFSNVWAECLYGGFTRLINLMYKTQMLERLAFL